MNSRQQTVSPVDGRVVDQRPLAADAQIEQTLARSRQSQPVWKHTSLATAPTCAAASSITLWPAPTRLPTS